MIGKRISPYLRIASAYFSVITIGALLLTLPFASNNGLWGNFLDSFFTATSAIAVTGLVVVDTATHWSFFGQLVILCLIQIGGMGIITIIALIFKFLTKKLSIKDSNTVMMSAGVLTKTEVGNIMKHVAIVTAICETVGAIVLTIRFSFDFAFTEALWKGIFIAISAFCNAGFDIMGTQASQFISLVNYNTDLTVNLTVMLLIQFGGLGFMVWKDLMHHKFNFKKYRLHSKIMLVANAVLVFGGAILFFLFEYGNTKTMGSYSVGNKVLMSFFQSVTCRTAGFNTVDMASLTDSSAMLSLALMAIGGGSGSTAGGMKITTFVVVIATIISLARGRKTVDLGKRSIGDDIIRQSMVIFSLWMSLTMIATTILCTADGVSVLQSLFECYSALGTVGLSMGITATLSIVSRLTLIILMFTGRIGIITLILAVVSRKKKQGNLIKPQENILIG